MTTPPTRSDSLRARLAASARPLRVLEAHDGLSADVVASARGGDGRGFDGIWISSFADALSRAQPDEDIVDLGARLASLDWIRAATSLPLVFDADGGGEPERAASIVARLVRHGVDAVVFEDKVGPKRNSLLAAAEQIPAPVPWFCTKLRAAARARGDASTMIVARLETLVLGGTPDEVVQRSTAYVEAGADALLVHAASPDPTDLFAAVSRCRAAGLAVPMFAIPTAYAHVDESALAAVGIDVVVYANQLVRAALLAMRDAARALLDAGRADAVASRCVPMQELLARYRSGP